MECDHSMCRGEIHGHLSQVFIDRIRFIRYISSDENALYYLTASNDDKLYIVKHIVKDAEISYEKSSPGALGRVSCSDRKGSMDILKYEVASVIPSIRAHTVQNDDLVDPYVILSFAPKLCKTDRHIKLFNGNPYSTLIVYSYYGLPVSENARKLMRISEIGVPEANLLSTKDAEAFWLLVMGTGHPYKHDIPLPLIKSLIARDMLRFRTIDGNDVRIHPNIVSDMNDDMTHFLRTLIFIPPTVYADYMLNPGDTVSIMSREVAERLSESDGMLIPPFAKDYLSYVQMNLNQAIDIKLGSMNENNLSEVPDRSILSMLGIEYLYQNRIDLVKKANIYIGKAPVNVVFRLKDEKEDVVARVGNRAKSESVTVKDLQRQIVMMPRYKNYDVLIIEVMALAAIYRPDLRDILSKELQKAYSGRTNGKASVKGPNAGVWGTVTEIPNYMHVIPVEKEEVTEEAIELTEFTVTYSLEGIPDNEKASAENLIESAIQRTIFEETKVDPTIVREFLPEAVEFLITIQGKVDVDRVRTAIDAEVKKLYERELRTTGEGELPIVTHMTFGLPNPWQYSKNFVSSYMRHKLNELVGPDDYSMLENVNTGGSGEAKVTYTIKINKLVDKRKITDAIRADTRSDRYAALFRQHMRSSLATK